MKGHRTPPAKAAVAIAEYRMAIDELDREIVNLTARLSANEYRLLVMIREFDERGGWLKWGLSNCPQWLHFRCDLSMSAAREKVRVAHALKELAEISAAFESGKLTYSKVRALTRVATQRNESELLAFALSTTAARVEERCRQLRNAEPGSLDDANRAHRRRTLSTWRDDRAGTMRFTLEVPVEAGELIARALDKAVEALPTHGPEFSEESWQTQQADALVAIMREYLAGGTGGESAASADHYQVVIHTDRSALPAGASDGKGRCDLPVETVKRLTCDGSLVAMTDGPDGEPLNVGRKQRTVSTAIKRALWARDRGCSFPGCTHTRFVDAHHVRHWADGGETSVGNTLLLCSAHHRLVHEGGYSIRKDHRGHWYFRRADGRAVPAFGYHPDDVTDEDVGDTADRAYGHASAEGFAHHRGAPEVREPRGRYRVLGLARESADESLPRSASIGSA